MESNIRHLEKMIVVDRRMGIAVPDSIYTLLDAYYEERLKMLKMWAEGDSLYDSRIA